MIQRVQSVWLILAAAAAFLTLQFNFYTGNMLPEGANLKQFIAINAKSDTLLLISSVATALLAAVAIFLYKDRKLQLKLVGIALVLSLLNILLFFLQTKKFIAGEGNYGIGAIIPLLVPIFLILAIRGIYKDNKLVKSLDRLR